MSPLSVSDTLPLDGGRFDVVIFDEASQITLEEAAPALCRARQIDRRRRRDAAAADRLLLFEAAAEEEEEDDSFEAEGEEVQYDLDAEQLSEPRREKPAGDDARLALPQPQRIADQLFQLGLLRRPIADRARGELARPRDDGAGLVSPSRQRRRDARAQATAGRAGGEFPLGALRRATKRRGTAGRPSTSRRLVRGLLNDRRRARRSAWSPFPKPSRTRSSRPSRGLLPNGTRVRRPAGSGVRARRGRAVRGAAGEEPGEHPGRRAGRDHPQRLLRPERPKGRCG